MPGLPPLCFCDCLGGHAQYEGGSSRSSSNRSEAVLVSKVVAALLSWRGQETAAAAAAAAGAPEAAVAGKMVTGGMLECKPAAVRNPSGCVRSSKRTRIFIDSEDCDDNEDSDDSADDDSHDVMTGLQQDEPADHGSGNFDQANGNFNITTAATKQPAAVDNTINCSSTSSSNGSIEPHQIGVICFFRAQVALVKEMLMAGEARSLENAVSVSKH